MSKILEMSHRDYLANPAFGSSDIIKMQKSFAYWKYMKANPEPSGRPMVVGSATHLMLQGEMTGNKKLASDGILVYQDGSSLTNGFKDFQKKYADKYCLDTKEQALCQRMIKALLDEPEVLYYIKDAIPEATIMANYPDTNVKAKTRPDYLHVAKGVAINIKTTSDGSEKGFLYSAADYGYDWQSAYSMAILSQELGKPFDEIHITVQKGDFDADCIVDIVSFSDDTIQCARGEIWEIMQRIPECEKTGIWPKNKAFLRQQDVPLHMRKWVKK